MTHGISEGHYLSLYNSTILDILAPVVTPTRAFVFNSVDNIFRSSHWKCTAWCFKICFYYFCLAESNIKGEEKEEEKKIKKFILKLRKKERKENKW